MRASKNYVYGAAEPDVCVLVDEAIRNAHQLRNKFCELELAKRDNFYQMLRRESGAYTAKEMRIRKVEEALGDARENIQAAKAKQNTSKPEGVEAWVDSVAECKAELKKLRTELKAIRKELLRLPHVQQWLKDAAEQHKAACKEAELDSGLYWGTRALVRDSCRSFTSGPPPRFARYSGEGQLAVQLQGGLAAEDVMKPNTLCYIESEERRTHAFIRIGSNGRQPMFARVPIILHRQLPAGSRIKWAYLERRKMADKDKWRLRVTIDTEVDTDKATWCAVHFGWLLNPSGVLRVALWEGCDGLKGTITLSGEHLEDYGRLDRVQAERDKARNRVLESLQRWLSGRERPEWMPSPKQIKSSSRLASVVLHWKKNRLPGDNTIFQKLDRWRDEDKRRWQHCCRLSARIVRRRKDLFRVVAKQLSDRYGVLYAAKIDAGKLAENSLPEDMVADIAPIHRQAKWAAPSTLLLCLQEKFPLHCIMAPSKNLTKECHKCGKVCPVNLRHRTTQCTSCKSWDVDENALQNTITRGRDLQESGELLVLEKAQENKEKASQERLKKMHEARKKKKKPAQGPST